MQTEWKEERVTTTLVDGRGLGRETGGEAIPLVAQK